MSNVTIQKKEKYYQYKFEIAKVDGKRKFLSKSGFKTKTEAEREGIIAYNDYINTGHDFFGKWNELFRLFRLLARKLLLYQFKISYGLKLPKYDIPPKDPAHIFTNMLGHKFIETTENFYISSTEKDKKDVSDIFDNFMSSDIINEIAKYEMGWNTSRHKSHWQTLENMLQ